LLNNFGFKINSFALNYLNYKKLILMADDDSFHNGVNILNDDEEDQIQMSNSKPGRRGVKKKGLLKEDSKFSHSCLPIYIYILTT
jgi:hypothetical protein